jgi:hypothetical protein
MSNAQWFVQPLSCGFSMPMSGPLNAHRATFSIPAVAADLLSQTSRGSYEGDKYIVVGRK